MKKLSCALVVCFAALFLTACRDTETYADQKNKERAAIKSFLEKQGIKVISESDFKRDTLTDVSKKEFVLFENTGIYMQIVRRGCGEKIKNGETVNILCRFNEYNLLTDSLKLTNNILYYSSIPDKMTVTNTLGTFTGTFINGVMMSAYNTTAVPAGWLVPLSYIKVGRMLKEDDQVARVNIIVPHSQGTSTAMSSVVPCYYELTYERGI
ncbi:MAG: DUF4827 domain-containing protein [Prevotella sp.]|nr:DUF4827 domain-containing protein [Prevotella sp.]